MIFFFCIWSLATLGFWALASTMSKHQKQYFGKELSKKFTHLATLLGWCALILSLLLSLSQGTPSNNVSYWFGTLTLAAIFVGLCTSYYAQHFKKIVTFIGIIFLCSIFLLV